MTNSRTFRATACLLLGSMTFASLPVQAATIPTHDAIEAAAPAAADARAALESLLARADVQEGLARYGVDTEQAAARVAAMSDAEVAELHGRLGEVPAGGSVVGAIVFIFVLLLITDILGLTKVFPFTRSVR